MLKHLHFKSLFLLLCLLVGNTSAWADTDFDFNLNELYQSGTKVTAKTVISTDGGTLSFTDKDKNFTILLTRKSSNQPGFYTSSGYFRFYSNDTFKLTAADGITITKVVITSNGSNYSLSTMDGLSQKTWTGSASEITFTGSGTNKWDKLTITYTTSGGSGSSEPSISLGTTTVNAPETAVSTTSIEVTYNNLTNYSAEVIFYEADGKTAATYDHSWITAQINASTKNLDYSITTNTGAARTAYLRVYALGDEGEVESSLITVTQAKKTVASPEFNLEGGSYMQGTNITISSAGNTVYYNLTTDGSAPANPTNASTEYTGSIALGIGKTIIKAIAYDTYGNASSVITRTYTGIALASLPFSWTGTSSAGKDELAKETGVVLSLATNYAESNAPYRLKFDGTNRYVIVYTDGKPEVVSFTAKLFNAASTGSKIIIQGSSDGIEFNDIEEFTIKGDANATFEFTTSNAFATTHRAIKLAMSSKDQNVAVGNISINLVKATLNASGYATLSSNHALDFSDDSEYSAWQITSVSGTAITFAKITGTVAEGTGILLKGTASASINIPVVASGTDISSTNKLVGITAATAIEADKYYGLSGNKFVKVNAGTVPAGKALLPASLISTAGARELTFIFEDETTGVSTVKTFFSNDKAMYNLKGQRIDAPRKGEIYIMGGKKMVNK